MKPAVPFTPDQAKRNKNTTFPDAVIHAFNELLTEKFGGRIIIKQDEVIERIRELDPKIERYDLFKNQWLDIESLFRDRGWKVDYEKAHYTDSYDSYWTFEWKGDK